MVWGDNARGQLAVPTAAIGTPHTTVDVNYDYGLALTSDGRIVGWGNPFSNQTSVPAPPAGQTFTAVAAGESHALALMSEGQIVTWGSRAYGAR